MNNPEKILSKGRVLIAAALLAFTPTLFGAANMDEEARLETDLRTLEVNAAQVAYHAAELESLLRNPGAFTITSHRYELNRIRDRVNNMGEMIPELQKLDLSPVQAEVVDDVSGLVKAMAAQTEKAINYLENNRPVTPLNVKNQAYAVRIAGVYHFAKHIDDLIDFAQAKLDVKEAQKDVRGTAGGSMSGSGGLR